MVIGLSELSSENLEKIKSSVDAILAEMKRDLQLAIDQLTKFVNKCRNLTYLTVVALIVTQKSIKNF